MPSVTLSGVGRHFGALKAVDSIDLAVEHGEFVTLLGPSGCGKTTTLRMVAGLERNDTGTIVIGGRVVSDAQAGLFVPPDHRKLGMVFQSYAIWPHMNVFDNVAFPLTVTKPRPSAREIKERTEKILEIVDEEAGRATGPLIHIQHESPYVETSVNLVPQVIDSLRQHGFRTISMAWALLSVSPAAVVSR